MVAFGETIFQKLVTNPLFAWEFFVVQQDTFHSHRDYEQVNFYKKSRLFIIGRSLQNGKVTTYLQLAQNCNLLMKNWKIHFFYQHSETICDVMQKEIEFVQGVNFEFIDSVKNNRTKTC